MLKMRQADEWTEGRPYVVIRDNARDRWVVYRLEGCKTRECVNGTMNEWQMEPTDMAYRQREAAERRARIENDKHEQRVKREKCRE